MVRQWIIGTVFGTLLIGVTSPWFVRSYLPRETNRGVKTLPVGYAYRWRSEGYATTQIGPHGMPGQLIADDPRAALRLALWGDSQTEGVCVADDQKIFAQVQKIAWAQRGADWRVYPLARSGDNLVDWMAQFAWAQQHLGVDAHVILVAELSDLSLDLGKPRTNQNGSASLNDSLARYLPDFVIQSARNVFTSAKGTSPRSLRFSVGPVSIQSTSRTEERLPEKPSSDFSEPLTAIARHSAVPVVIVYAPLSPRIVAGEKRWDDPDGQRFHAMAQQAKQLGIAVIDARLALERSARSNRWPHGFHHGRIGSGHLNAVGNQVVAAAIADKIQPFVATGKQADHGERPFER